MLNIIKIKEEQNILSFDEDSKIDIVSESTNFYLEFELDEEWLQCPIVTVVFDFQGQLVQVELDENYQCQIPRSNAPRVVFSITGEPSQTEKLSSTMLCLNILPTDNTNLQDIPFYEDAHRNLLGIIADLEEGNITAKNALSADYAETAGTVENATHATTADSATYAETTGNVENANHSATADSATFATTAGSSQTQVSLTGDETISGTKNFTGNLQSNGVTVATANDLSTKQNTLTFDSTPTASSTNPVTSGGVYTALQKGYFYCRGTFGTTQAISGWGGTINTYVSTNLNGFTYSNGGLTCTKAGKYFLMGTGMFYTTKTTYSYGFELKKNNTSITYGAIKTSSTSDRLKDAIQCIVDLNVGDVVKLNVNTDNANASCTCEAMNFSGVEI